MDKMIDNDNFPESDVYYVEIDVFISKPSYAPRRLRLGAVKGLTYYINE